MRTIASLIYPDVMSLDVTGPLQVFASANVELRRQGQAEAYRLRVLGEQAGPVATSAGFQLVAEQAWRDGQAPLHAVEGFIRQILGWREYVRGMYWAHMPGYTESNHLGHSRPLPEWFWTGRTRMACLASAVGQSLEHAYAHHIQRLMVIGNFALLAGLDPIELHHWYLGIYIDAFEWVEAPNTLGMSQWADGGRLATKPYASSAAYLQRMGDHCKGCAYDPKARIGEQACPFNALYWDFFDRHGPHFQGNPRLGVVYHQLRRMDVEALTALRQQAAINLTRLAEL